MKWLLIQINFKQWWHKQKETINLEINGADIKGQNSVPLLGVEIEKEWNFINYI